MQGALFSIGVILTAVMMVSAYKVNRFHTRRIGYLSLVQVFYSVIVPLILMPMFYVYIKSILVKPRTEVIFLSDDAILLLLLLSAMFAYGGLVIHGIFKMMEGRVNKFLYPDLYEMVSFFHLSFSHNLTYAGAIMIGACVALLEMNHVSLNEWTVLWAVVRGVVLGLAMLVAMINYAAPKPKKKEMFDKWITMRFVFLTSWIMLFVFLWGIKRTDPQLDAYQMVIPMLVGLATINLFSVLIVVKKLRGRWRLAFNFVRLDKVVRLILKGQW